MKAIQDHRRIVCGREIQNSIADSAKRLIEDKIKQYGLVDAFDITDTEIRYPPCESLFIFKGLQKHTVDSIKSLEGFHDLWIEEAHTTSQRSLDTAIPTFRQGDSEIACSWNPDDPRDPVDVFFAENKDDPEFVHVHTDFRSVWVRRPTSWSLQPEEAKKDRKKHYMSLVPRRILPDIIRDRRRDPEKYQHVWLGEHSKRSEARVFHNWHEMEFKTPKDARFYFGADWGFAKDPTVLIRCWIEDDCIYVDHEVVDTEVDIHKIPFMFAGTKNKRINELNQEALKSLSPEQQVWRGVPGATTWSIRADSARPEIISYLREHGFPKITKSKKGAGSVEEGVEFLKSYDIYVHPRCIHTIHELQSYSYEVDKKTGEILPKLADKDNHVIDALRYALEEKRRTEEEVDAFEGMGGKLNRG